MAKSIAQDLLEQAHSPSTAEAIFTNKVIRKPLRLRPTSPDPTSQDARAQRRLRRLRKEQKQRRRQKPKSLSAKEKRVTGIYDIPDNAKKYDIYVPLHRMWIEYMWEVLGMKEGAQVYVNSQNAGSKLASADYHGVEVTVVRSTCAGMVGITGIIVRDTKFTFQLITQKNLLKTIPKKHTIFRFSIPQPTPGAPGIGQGSEVTQPAAAPQDLVFELHGSQFEHRPADRATKKMKQRVMNDL